MQGYVSKRIKRETEEAVSRLIETSHWDDKIEYQTFSTTKTITSVECSIITWHTTDKAIVDGIIRELENV